MFHSLTEPSFAPAARVVPSAEIASVHAESRWAPMIRLSVTTLFVGGIGHRRTVRSEAHDAKVFPSGSQANELIGGEYPVTFASGWPLVESQTWKYHPVAASIFPSGLNASAVV